MKKMPMNLAHRGFSAAYPENTRAAYLAAFEIDGCDGLEMDVHFSKDGKLVVIHDPILGRTSNGTGPVCEHTYSELLELDLGSWKSPEFSGERIMLLSEVLDLCKDAGKFCNIEIKNYEVFYEGIEEAVIKEILDRKMNDSVLISSFNHISMEKCKEICPEIHSGLLYDKPLAYIKEYVGLCKSDAVNPNYRLLKYDRTSVGTFRELGKEVHVWTVNTEEDMRDMINQGVDSIISNHPDVLAKVMAE